MYYELACLGPRKDVRLSYITDTSWAKVMEAASKASFLSITELAPGIYPRWAHWNGADALTLYRRGLNQEKGADATTLDDHGQARYRLAETYYREASRLDPDNMLARLRGANCAEQMMLEANADELIDKRIAALKDYVAIRLREPTLFSARYRASIPLSLLADSERRFTPGSTETPQRLT